MTEQIIATHLFLQNECVLPGIGTLQLQRQPAQVDYSDHAIKAASHIIIFIPQEHGPSVSNELLKASQVIKIDLDNHGSCALTGIGTFTRDKDGVIHFAAAVIAPAFKPLMSAPGLMRHQKNVVRTKKRTPWLQWAALLVVVAAASILTYTSSSGSGNSGTPFGNAGSVSPANESPTYQLPAK